MIKELKDLGLSQSMIAAKMKVTRQTVNLWFQGERFPTIRNIEKMAKAMSELTGKTITPAYVFKLLSTVAERRKREKELQGGS